MTFLSAVAGRFGMWGAYGQPHVALGNYARFVDYTAKLNWFLPPLNEDDVLLHENEAGSTPRIMTFSAYLYLSTRFFAETHP